MFLIDRKDRNLVLLKIPYPFIADVSIYFVSISHFLEVTFPKLKTIAELVDPEKTCKNAEIAGKTKVSCVVLLCEQKLPDICLEQLHKCPIKHTYI